MNKATVIAVDAMGGDHAPGEIIKGCVEASEQTDIQLVLVGDTEKIQPELCKYKFDSSKIQMIHASEIIEMDDSPVTSIRNKKDSSMVVGLNLLRKKKADAFISAGNTGALLAGGTLLVGRIKGVERPALAPLIPNKKGFSLLIDGGANMDAKPNYLLQFAKMGSVYMENVVGVPSPKVGLINVGAEKEKGSHLTKDTYPLLEESDLHFIGNVEAREIPYGQADVLVCDAFTGNVILKYTEGFGLSLFDIIKEEIMKKTSSKLAALFLKPVFKGIKNRFDYTEYGGAPLLGLKGLVIKVHGSSEAKVIKSAIKQAVRFTEQEMNTKIEEKINQ